MDERITLHFTDLQLSRFAPSFMHWGKYLDALVGNCVIANGCFDIIHPGHLEIFKTLDMEARQKNVRAVVALNSDTSVKLLKGPARPIIPASSRAALINSLVWPITVIIFEEQTPQLLMDTLRPLAVVKGSEYDRENVIRWSGSEVISVGMVKRWSTTRIISGNGGV